MRVRIKFSKTGSMKYIGHLDTMRFFQKALRRANIDVAYSEGFSPHMLMSFAQPLSVGVTSDSEYFDVDLKSGLSSEEMVRRLNEQMPEDIAVKGAVKIPEDKANKCMTLVNAADYIVSFSDGKMFEELKGSLEEFLNKKEIVVLKKTKKSEALTDIRPFIFDFKIREKDVFFKLSCGSVNNLKPKLIFDAFSKEAGIEPDSIRLRVHREEIYTIKEGEFIPLIGLGEEMGA